MMRKTVKILLFMAAFMMTIGTSVVLTETRAEAQSWHYDEKTGKWVKKEYKAKKWDPQKLCKMVNKMLREDKSFKGIYLPDYYKQELEDGIITEEEYKKVIRLMKKHPEKLCEKGWCGHYFSEMLFKNSLDKAWNDFYYNSGLDGDEVDDENVTLKMVAKEIASGIKVHEKEQFKAGNGHVTYYCCVVGTVHYGEPDTKGNDECWEIRCYI